MADAPPDLTLTAGQSGATRPAPPSGLELAPGGSLGRYRLIRALGAGGMGLVWAAHDPDLDREVAIKVLRHGDASPAQRARLLREARAMAKVRHPNVIMVHEVGTADGRDYVAMELVTGATVAQWMAAARRPAAEVRRVFRDAGRGLAAAHAAHLVHRDFKPHNVLVADDGRVLVTDFGLARAMGDDDAGDGAAALAAGTPDVAAASRAPAVDLADTVDAGAAAPPRGADRSTLDSALTEAGALLGTPAYMAPEQIDGGAAGARADQFAYCVALWEALAGERPFRGGSLVELRAAIAAGPTGGGALPRGVRPILARGLAADPARRWPDMTALLRALDRSARRPGWVMFLAADAVIAAIVLAWAAWPSARAPAAAPCPSAREALAILAPGAAKVPAAADPVLAKLRDEVGQAWSDGCRQDDRPRLDCLRQVLWTANMLEGAAATAAADGLAPDLGGLVPAASTCYARPPATLPEARPEDAGAERVGRALAAGVRLRAAAQELDGLVARADEVVARARAGHSCVALSEALLARAEALMTSERVAAADDAFDEAIAAADPCRHLRVMAEATIGRLAANLGHDLDADRARALRASAAAAIERAGSDPVLTAQLDVADGTQDYLDGRLDQAITALDGALSTFERRGALSLAGATGRELAEMYVERSGPGDLERGRAVADRLARALAERYGAGDRRTVAAQRMQLMLAWKRGDAAAVGALRAAIAAQPRAPTEVASPVSIRGRVVDEAGRPVAGATVVAGVGVLGDGDVLDFSAGGPGAVGPARTAQSGADGGFAIDDAPPGSWVIAQGPGGLRSLPVAGAGAPVLRLGPTSRVRGHVEVGARPPSSLVVDAVPAGGLAMWSEAAPIAADGSFVLDHLPRGRWSVKVQGQRGFSNDLVAAVIDADRPEVGPVELALQKGGVAVDVVVRADVSSTMPAAQVNVMTGRAEARTLAELVTQVRSASYERSVVAHRAARADERAGDVRLERDDLIAHVDGLAAGDNTVCVIPLGSDTIEPTNLANLYLHAADLAVHCRTVTLAPGATPALLFVVPPMKRLP